MAVEFKYREHFDCRSSVFEVPVCNTLIKKIYTSKCPVFVELHPLLYDRMYSLSLTSHITVNLCDLRLG